MKLELLAQYHRDLGRLFRGHQIALVEHEFGEAIRRLDRFEAALHLHAREEETHILPAFALTVGTRPGASVEMFEAEHRKIESLLARVHGEVAMLPQERSPEQLLEVLEHEARLKGLLEHHFLREENLLFPELDRVLPERDRDRLLRSCTLRAIAQRLPAKLPPRQIARRRSS